MSTLPCRHFNLPPSALELERDKTGIPVIAGWMTGEGSNYRDRPDQIGTVGRYVGECAHTTREHLYNNSHVTILWVCSCGGKCA